MHFVTIYVHVEADLCVCPYFGWTHNIGWTT